MYNDYFDAERNKGFLFLLYILWPFGAFLYALKHFRKKESAIIFILFAMLYGYTFMHRADSERVKNEFQEVANLQGTDVRKYFTEKTRETPDIFLPLVNITVSRVTASPHILYMVYAFIYFSFVIACFYSLYKLTPPHSKIKIESALFLLLFLLYIRYSAINGVRFWIACFIFSYSLIRLIYYNEKKFLFLILSTPLIHFAYLFVLPIVAIYYALRKNILLCYAFLIFSLFFNMFISIDFLESLGIFSPANISRMSLYLYEGNVESNLLERASTRWVVKYGGRIAQWTMSIGIFIPVIIHRIKLSDTEKNMYAFLIVFLAGLQFTKSSYDMHYRFFEVFILISITFLYKLSLKPTFNIKPYSIMITLLLLPQILFGLRASMETTNIGLFISTLPTIPIFNNDPVSLVDVLNLIR